MKKIAIIPARGGSQRIPGKNIKKFLGKPIISYSIGIALESSLFDEVMVSTDDEEIGRIAMECGAKVPFYRSSRNADHFATTSAVIEEVLGKYKEAGTKFDLFACIYPTAPLISMASLKAAYQLLTDKNYDSVYPVCRFGYPIQRSLKLENGKLSMMWPENLNMRSQDLAPAYHDAGQFYLMKVPEFLKKKAIFTDNSGAIVLSETEVQDIDNETDWEIAELKYQLLRKKAGF